MKVISLISRKGGTAKTTTAVNLASYFGLAGERVLLLDVDSQAGATKESGVYNFQHGIENLLDGTLLNPEEAVISTPFKFDLIPASSRLSYVEMNLKPYNFGLLKSILSKFKDRYDVVFIDTPPTESSLTIFSIAASTHALVPLQVDKKALDSLDLTVNEILTVKEAVNPNLVFLGILPTLYYGRAAVSKFVLKKIQQDYGDHVLPVVIKYKALYKEASLASQPVAFYLKKHDNEDYYKLFKILQERIC